MGPVVIVVVEPVAEGLVSGLVVGPGLGVGPFAFEGLVVSFHFAVLLKMVRSDRDMTDVVLGEQGSEAYQFRPNHSMAIQACFCGCDFGILGLSGHFQHQQTTEQWFQACSDFRPVDGLLDGGGACPEQCLDGHQQSIGPAVQQSRPDGGWPVARTAENQACPECAWFPGLLRSRHHISPGTI